MDAKINILFQHIQQKKRRQNLTSLVSVYFMQTAIGSHHAQFSYMRIIRLVTVPLSVFTFRK